MYVGLGFERPVAFASEDWCRIPFKTNGKTPFDKIVDILLQIPGTQVLRQKMGSLRKSNESCSEPLRKTLEDQASQLLSRLARFWQENSEVINASYNHGRFFEASGFEHDAEDWVIEESKPGHFYDTFAATNIALYDATCVLTNALAVEAMPISVSTKPYKRKIAIHCASILSIAACLESKGPSSGGSLIMVFPIKTVCRATPCYSQRKQATDALERWGASRGIDGLCTFRVDEKFGIYDTIRRMEEARQAKSRQSDLRYPLG